MDSGLRRQILPGQKLPRQNARRQKGIYLVLAAAGSYGFLAASLAANLCEGYAKARIASDGGAMLDAIIARNFDATLRNFFTLGGFVVLMAAGIFIKDSLLGQYLEKGMLRLRRKTVESLGETQMSWLDEHHTGRLSARVMADLNALGGALRPVLIMGISVVIYNCVSLVFMFMADWLLTLIVFAIVPVTSLLQWFSSHPIAGYRKANQEAVGALSQVVFDCFGNFETVKSLSLEDEMRRRFETAREKQVDAAVKETRVIAGLTVFSGVGRFLPQLVLLLVGGIFVINQRMTLGQLTMFIVLSRGVIQVVGNMAGLIGNIRQLAANGERVAALWDAPKERRGGLAELFAESSGTDRGVSVPAVSFDRVSFKYRDDRANSLSDVSFEIPRGAFVALVGESGSGKSTVMKLAVSLYSPAEGSVRVLGRDNAEWDLAALRRRIAYVTQESYLFPGSLAGNIRSGVSPGADGAFLEECVRAAGLSAFVKSLPDGLEANAGERGVFLSGGQRQRISIARALYKKADIIFLDEATSALDRATEEAVLRGVREPRARPGGMKERPTLVAITHSLANARDADRIIVFSDGRIAESGTHGELVARNGVYNRLLKGGEGGAL